jgi:hypothetical protein
MPVLPDVPVPARTLSRYLPGRDFPRYRFLPGVHFKVVSDRHPRFTYLPVLKAPWNEATEGLELATADIGVSWLPNDSWSRGDCGLRVLQCMAAGLPVVANTVLGFDDDERDYGVAARMLQKLGCTRVYLMTNNPAKLDGFCRAPPELLHSHGVVRGLDHHAVAAADRGGGRDDDHGVVAIGRLHGGPRNLKRVSVLVADARKRDFVPAMTGRKSGIVEIAVLACLRQADQRNRCLGRGMAAVVDQLHEDVDAGAGRRQRLCHRLG